MSDAEDGHQKFFTRDELIHHHKNGFVPSMHGTFRLTDTTAIGNRFQYKNGEYHQVRGLPPSANKSSKYDDTLEEHDTISNLHDKLKNMSNPEYHEAIREYTGEASQHLNSSLIHNHLNFEPIDKETRYKIDTVSDGINKSSGKPDADFHVYTGISRRTNIHDIVSKSKKDTVAIHFPAFTSTSLSRATATGFAYGKDDTHLPPEIGKPSDVLKIRIPAGHQRGMYVDHISENTGEHEYLLDKGHVVHIPKQEPKYEFSTGFPVRHWDAYVKHHGEEHE